MKKNAYRPRGMRKNQKWVFIILNCVLLILLALTAALWMYGSSSSRVWVNGRDISVMAERGYTMDVGGGTATYDPETGTLTLAGVHADDSARGAAVYSMGDLTVVFSGESVLDGDKYGIYARGSLTLTGENSAEISGEKYGVYARGGISVAGYVSLTLVGGEEAVRSAAEEFETDRLFLYQDAEGAEIASVAGRQSVCLRAPVRLSYVSHGGGDLPAEEYRYGTDGRNMQQPNRDGFVFQGWYVSRDFEEEYDPSLPITEDVTVYALWEKYADRVLTGIDVSGHQEEIDWQQVAESGVEFALIRAGFRGYGETGSLNRDEYFDANMTGAAENGILTGIYFYSQAVSVEEAVEEAEFVLEILGEHGIDLPVFYDMEYAEDADGYVGRFYDAHLTAEEKAELCRAFCDRIEEAGHDAMVYANFRLLSDGLGAELEEMGIGVWLAHWREHTYYDRDYDYWQYSASGEVAGIVGDVDMNEWYVLYHELPEGFPLPEEPVPETEDTAEE